MKFVKSTPVSPDMTRPDEFVCTWAGCGRSFSRAAKLADHMNAHQGIRPHQCDKCEKSFVRADHLKRHSLVHKEPGTPGQFACELCARTFSLRHQLQRHLKTHNKKPAVFACDICGESFGKASKLAQHRAEAHQIPTTFTCPQCSKTFTSDRQLKKHVKRHSKVYACELCQQIFPKWSALVAHRRSAHSASTTTDDDKLIVRMIKCGECGKVLSSKSALKVHLMTVHDREKPFKCGKCERTFGHKHLLQRHLRECT